MLERLQRIRSHAGLARYIATLEDDPIGYLARVQVEDIPSPYRYAPTVPIWCDADGRPVVWFETSHRCYDVFLVPPELLRFVDEDQASDWHIRYSKRRP